MYKYIIFTNAMKYSHMYGPVQKNFGVILDTPIEVLLDNEKSYIITKKGEIIMKHIIQYIQETDF